MRPRALIKLDALAYFVNSVRLRQKKITLLGGYFARQGEHSIALLAMDYGSKRSRFSRGFVANTGQPGGLLC